MSDELMDPNRRKVYRARNFAKSAMACPGCRAVISEPVDQCPRCGFTGHTAVAKFPFAAPAMDWVIDPSGYLGEEARMKIKKALDHLEKKFPQVRMSFCIIDLLAETDVREFGFWMFNASRVRDESEARQRPWTILLIIDDRNGRASITPGYAIEPFLRDESWDSLLRMERRHFFSKDYETGILRLIDGANQIFKEGAERVIRMAKRRKGGSR